jgi:flagellum-specific peptidoglycan hydrolase FlgJ
MIRLIILMLSISSVREFSFVEHKINSSIEIVLRKKEIPDVIREKLRECYTTDSLMVEIIVAQARFESGNFTNSLTKNHNNIFSMRHPKIRSTTSLGPLANAEGRTGYASYSSIESATEDFILWLNFTNIPTKLTTNNYVKLLKAKRYFEASEKHYKKGINYYLHAKI